MNLILKSLLMIQSVMNLFCLILYLFVFQYFENIILHLYVFYPYSLKYVEISKLLLMRIYEISTLMITFW